MSTNESLNIFLKNYKKEKEHVFKEIYDYLEAKKIISKKKFIENAIEKLSKEINKIKRLPSGLLLTLNKSNNPLLKLTDDKLTFFLPINFIKEITIKNNITSSIQKHFIISELYYDQVIKRNKCIKYKTKNNQTEIILEAKDLETKVVYNEEFEYLILNPYNEKIYKNVFGVIKKERKNSKLNPEEFFNEYRLLNYNDLKNININEIKFDDIYYDNLEEGNKYYCYNGKIGLSTYIQKNIIYEPTEVDKCFYLNIEYLLNEKWSDNIRKYL